MEIVPHLKELPGLENGSVHIWGIYLPEVAPRLDRLEALLSASEKEKAERFRRESDRLSSIAARGALRVLLGGYDGMAADEISFAYNEQGKPYLAHSKIAFNVSHSGDWVVLAVGRERTLGVDIEQLRSNVDPSAIAERYFTLEEQELLKESEQARADFYRIWVRKEAYVKARGSGLFRELNRVCVPVVQGRIPVVAEQSGWIFRHIEAGSKYAAALVSDRPVEHMPCYDFNRLCW